jgi:hypothetical protein
MQDDEVLKLLEADSAVQLPDNMNPQAESEVTGIPDASDITLMTVNFWRNQWEKTTWIKSNEAFTLQFFTMTKPFTPHPKYADRECIAQLHEPGWWIGYLDDYTKENAGKRPVMSKDQWAWYKSLTNETLDMPKHGGGPLLGQVYDHKGGGTTYHWGAVTRMWVNKYDEMRIDLFLDGKLFHQTIHVDEPNTETNPKMANVKLRGRYDPKGLWIRSRKKK